MICRKCNKVMTRVISFSKGKQEEYYLCKNCRNETKHIKVSSSHVENIYKDANNNDCGE